MRANGKSAMNASHGPRARNRGYVYVLRPGLLLVGREVCKIGHTRRPVNQRVRELGTGSIFHLEVAYSIEVEDARGFERQLHSLFRDRRIIRGGGTEFFDVPAAEVIVQAERMATAVSRKRARDAAGEEMQLLRRRLGISRIETAIGIISGVACFVPACLSAIILFPMMWRLPLGFFHLILTPFSFILVLSLIGRAAASIFYFLQRRFVEPKYGNRLSAKLKELRRRYTLAYS